MKLVKKYLNEWKRANDFLNAARNNLKLGDLKTVANREYFALERAIVSVLLMENKKVSKNHKKIWEMSRVLDLNVDVFNLMRKLYDLRLQADYGKTSHIVELSEGNVINYLSQVELLIKRIREKYNLK